MLTRHRARLSQFHLKKKRLKKATTTKKKREEEGRDLSQSGTRTNVGLEKEVRPGITDARTGGWDHNIAGDSTYPSTPEKPNKAATYIIGNQKLLYHLALGV